MEFPKRYDPAVEESKWQEFWAKEKLYVYDPEKGGETYVVDTPPPTVSGKMHLGHAFSYSQQDFVARFQRMRGRNVFYPFGTDDNGLPTEKLVEKLKKVRSTTMKRNEFVDLCFNTIKEIQPSFIKSWIDIGMSCDFDGTYSTIDPHCQKTSQASFIDLFKKNHVHRQETPISWCVHCQTAIAQAEFENVTLNSSFNDIKFTSGGKELIISTTRPELIPACVALFYHPADKRYADLKGKFAKVPIFGYEVPILGDENVDMEKGTGLMMVCTFGDKEDVEKWHKHSLELRIVFTKDGRMNDLAKPYQGLKIKEMRKKMLEDLESSGDLISQKNISHAVNVHERCGTEIEFLKTPQWYIHVIEKKREFLDAGDKITWYPEHMKTRYVHWVENLSWDWCISRQRHFGVPFPVWYCKKCNLPKVAEESELPVDPLTTKPSSDCSCGSKEFEPELDVMDTWATSSVTPQIILNWKSKGKYDIDMKKYPCSLRPQAHDIIRTWAFYTIVKGVYNNGDIPWSKIMISGHAQDPHGRKMSKSKGNVVEPEKMIEKYSADALRFWAAGSKLGDDLPFQEKDLVTGKKTITKLFNASKFSLMHLEDYDGEFNVSKLEPFDRWLLSKLHSMIKDSTFSFEEYEYSKVKRDVDQFFWMTFCDNYLEICKDRLYNADRRGADARKSAQYTLYNSILSVLKMFAPIMPHVTESIYQVYFKGKENMKSIHVSSWPELDESFIDPTSEKAGDLAVEIISKVRKYKSENGHSLSAEVKSLKLGCDKESQDMLNFLIEDLKATTKAEEVIFELSDSLEIAVEMAPKQ